MPTIDVVVTTHRNTEKLKVCLEKILDVTKHVRYRVIVWCNDPNDEVKKTIHDSIFVDDIQFTDRIRPIFNDSNDGSFSSNNNLAASLANGDYILFLNDDVEPISETWLYDMQNMIQNDPKIGAVGALLLYPDKKTIQHCGVFFSHKTNNLPFHMHYKQPLDSVAQFVSQPRYYQAVTAACMLVRRKDFAQLGGFHEEYKNGFEDVDLCLGLKQLNKTCVYCPTAQLIHHEGISGQFKNHPNIDNNIKVFRSRCTGKYYDDYDFYTKDPKFMIYKAKT